ncbi:MAG: L,D-transpeptidase [Solirubrobacteraceae bacterium]
MPNFRHGRLRLACAAVPLTAAFLALLASPSASAAGAASVAGVTPPAGSYEIATAGPAGVRLYATPSARGGSLAKLAAWDDRGSPTTLAVLGGRGAWLHVLTASEQSGGPAWLDNRPVWVPRARVALSRTGLAIDVSLRSRRLELRLKGRVIGAWRVGVGAPGSPTPVGRFEVTQKLPGSYWGPAYGRVIIGLSVIQRRGGLAGLQVVIHGTNDPGSIGAAVSNGCVHGSASMMERLSAEVPLGAPVFVTR